MPDPSPELSRTEVDRSILRLAIPSLGALIAEPVFVMVDSAFIARVSTTSLAGLGLASTVLTTVVSLSIFLAYSTTAAVSRAFGAGRIKDAIARGVDASWLGLFIGAACALILVPTAPWMLGLFGSGADVLSEATHYLRISALGLPAMLAVQATTGLVRGMQDARLPLVVAAGGAILNIPLNALLVFGAGWGIVGSAVGTVLCQCLMAGVLLGAVVRYARTHQVPLRPHLDQVMDTGRESVPMFLRSVSLRLVMVVTVVVAARLGDVQLAAHQLANTIFGLLALALDSLAIAGQALTGRHLGARQTEVVRTITRRLMTWGVLGGLVVGLLLLAASYGAPTLFSPDPAVQENLRAALWVLVIAQPVAGYVFVLDGVLMGAGDAPYLAKAGMITALAVMPGAIAVGVLTPIGPWGTACLWIATNLLYMVARAISLGLRVRTDTWMHVEA